MRYFCVTHRGDIISVPDFIKEFPRSKLNILQYCDLRKELERGKSFDYQLSTGEMSELLGVSNQTLQLWDNTGKLVAYRTISNRRYYTLEHFRAWLKLMMSNVINNYISRYGDSVRDYIGDNSTYSHPLSNVNNYKHSDGIWVVEVVSENDDCVSIICPYCGHIHNHGKSSGHRLSHCSTRDNDGYYINWKGDGGFNG